MFSFAKDVITPFPIPPLKLSGIFFAKRYRRFASAIMLGKDSAADTSLGQVQLPVER